MTKVEHLQTWAELKAKLLERFQPINKVKIARDKLAVWKQLKSVALYKESFMKIIIDIPKISTDEVIDRYMRGLKPYISKELCTTSYQSLATLMSHAFSIEASKSSFLRTYEQKSDGTGPVPMDVSNVRLRFRGQNQRDYEEDLCFSCHKKGCRSAICSERKSYSRKDYENQGKDSSQ